MSNGPRRKKRINYRLSPTPSLDPPDDADSNPTFKLPSPDSTYMGMEHSAGKTWIIDDEYTTILLWIYEFDILDGIERIIGSLFTKDGLIKGNGILLKSQCPFEFWISTATRYRKQLLDLGWIILSEIKMYRMPRSFRCKFKKNEMLYFMPNIYCNECIGECAKNCITRKLPKILRVKILQVYRPYFMGDLDPNYRIQIYNKTWNSYFHSKNIWAQTAQLYREKTTMADHEYTTLDHIIYENVLKNPKYKMYCMLGAANIPPYIDIDSTYYRKNDVYFSDSTKILLASGYNSLFQDEYKKEINFILNKTFLKCLKSQILSKDISIRATKYNLLRHSCFASPFKLQYRLIPYLLSEGVELKFNESHILFEIPFAKIASIRDDGLIIFTMNGSKVELTSNIAFKWIRKTEELFVCSFGYVYQNRHITNVDINDNEEKQNEENEDHFSDSELY